MKLITPMAAAEWCVNHSRGATVRVPLPFNWLNNDGYLGFIICHFGDDRDDGSDFTFVLDEMSTVANLRIPAEPVVMLFACSLYEMIAEDCSRLTQCSYAPSCLTSNLSYLHSQFKAIGR